MTVMNMNMINDDIKFGRDSTFLPWTFSLFLCHLQGSCFERLGGRGRSFGNTMTPVSAALQGPLWRELLHCCWISRTRQIAQDLFMFFFPLSQPSAYCHHPIHALCWIIHLRFQQWSLKWGGSCTLLSGRSLLDDRGSTHRSRWRGSYSVFLVFWIIGIGR